MATPPTSSFHYGRSTLEALAFFCIHVHSEHILRGDCSLDSMTHAYCDKGEIVYTKSWHMWGERIHMGSAQVEGSCI
jgi:hypothetical protein